MPKAEHVPPIEWEYRVTPTPNNPLGAKGVGEAGAIAAPPAVVNAVVDVLSPLGATDVDMPLTSESVWRAFVSSEAIVARNATLERNRAIERIKFETAADALQFTDHVRQFG